jgi:hypothetical protein
MDKPDVTSKLGECTSFAIDLLGQLKAAHDNLHKFADALLPHVDKQIALSLAAKMHGLSSACEELDDVICAAADSIDAKAKP